MTYPREYQDKCRACGKELVYSIMEDRYEFCNCTELKEGNCYVKVEHSIPVAKDQVSLADSFENDVQALIHKYSGQGLTIGTATGALQNRIFELQLNIHMQSIVEIVQRNMNK